MFQLKVTHKMAFVLVALSVGPMMVAALVGFIPLNDEQMLRERTVMVEQLAAISSNAIEVGKKSVLASKISDFLKANRTIDKVRIARFDGLEFFASPDFGHHWTLSPTELSNLNAVRIPIYRQGKPWANVETIFYPVAWHQKGLVRFLVILGMVFVMNALSFGFFLNRSLAVLEPNSAVPRRVRNTLDTIVGGVVVLDGKGRIMMANESFTRSLASDEKIVGNRLSNFPWRFSDDAKSPWDKAIQDARRCEGAKVFLKSPQGIERCFVVNATPVHDAQDHMAGCMVSFEDISVLEEQRKDLVAAMTALAASKEEVRQQNVRL